MSDGFEKIKDILADWKNSKFVVCERSEPYQEHTVILCDYEYWTEHYDELVVWCRQNSCDLSGLVVTIPQDQSLTLFLLKWS